MKVEVFKIDIDIDLSITSFCVLSGHEKTENPNKLKPGYLSGKIIPTDRFAVNTTNSEQEGDYR